LQSARSRQGRRSELIANLCLPILIPGQSGSDFGAVAECLTTDI